MADTHAALHELCQRFEKNSRHNRVNTRNVPRQTQSRCSNPRRYHGKDMGKEDELKQLKSELASLDRKIAAELAPSMTITMARRINRSNLQSPQTGVKPETTLNTVVVQPTDTEHGHKPSMVAEPHVYYSKGRFYPKF